MIYLMTENCITEKELKMYVGIQPMNQNIKYCNI